MNTIQEANNAIRELTAQEVDAVNGGYCNLHLQSISYTCPVDPPGECYFTFTYAC